MSIFKAIYNFFAQRELGALLGMKWNPEDDPIFQRKMNDHSDTMKAAQWIQVHLPDAQKRIEAGDYDGAHRIVNRALLELSNSSHPLITKARNEAGRIHQVTSAHVDEPDSGKSSTEYFNEAASLARTLNVPVSKPGEYNAVIAEIIRLSQLAIRKDSRNGDAYVVMANAYSVLAHNGGSTDLYNSCIGKAGAVIYRWKTAPVHTLNRAAGEQIYREITTYIEDRYPLPADLRPSVYEMEYASAVNPDEFPYLMELIEKAALPEDQ